MSAQRPSLPVFVLLVLILGALMLVTAFHVRKTEVACTRQSGLVACQIRTFRWLALLPVDETHVKDVTVAKAEYSSHESLYSGPDKSRRDRGDREVETRWRLLIFGADGQFLFEIPADREKVVAAQEALGAFLRSPQQTRTVVNLPERGLAIVVVVAALVLVRVVIHGFE